MNREVGPRTKNLKKDAVRVMPSVEGNINEDPTSHLKTSIEALMEPNLKLSEEQIAQVIASLGLLREKAAPRILEAIGKRVAEVIKNQFEKDVKVGDFGYNFTFNVRRHHRGVEFQFPYEIPYTSDDQRQILSFLERKFPGIIFTPGAGKGVGTLSEAERNWRIELPYKY